MFLSSPPPSPSASALYEHDIEEDGYVMNATRLWAWRPDVLDAFMQLRKLVADRATLSLRERGVLVCTVAAQLGDAYCALAWGTKLASESDPTTAAAVIGQRRDIDTLSARERALAAWAEQVVRDPNGTAPREVQRLRDAGLTEDDIFNATVFIAFRIAFSTVNDALGARPDWQLADAAPAEVRDAVDFGRPVADRGAA